MKNYKQRYDWIVIRESQRVGVVELKSLMKKLQRGNNLEYFLAMLCKEIELFAFGRAFFFIDGDEVMFWVARKFKYYYEENLKKVVGKEKVGVDLYGLNLELSPVQFIPLKRHGFHYANYENWKQEYQLNVSDFVRSLDAGGSGVCS